MFARGAPARTIGLEAPPRRDRLYEAWAGWQYVGVDSPADLIAGIYRRHALAWTRLRAQQGLVEAAWLDSFFALLPSRPMVLDIGCGSGQPIAGHLAARGCTLTGVDASPEMIAFWHSNLPGQGAHVADMRNLALGTLSDGILAWDSFFHLRPDDQRRMFPVFRAQAARSAALMFTTGTHQGEAIGMLEGDPLYHASLDPAEYRALLDENGFAVAAHAVQDPDCGGRTVWLAQLR